MWAVEPWNPVKPLTGKHCRQNSYGADGHKTSQAFGRAFQSSMPEIRHRLDGRLSVHDSIHSFWSTRYQPQNGANISHLGGPGVDHNKLNGRRHATVANYAWENTIKHGI